MDDWSVCNVIVLSVPVSLPFFRFVVETVTSRPRPRVVFVLRRRLANQLTADTVFNGNRTKEIENTSLSRNCSGASGRLTIVHQDPSPEKYEQ